eukprot:scaffold18778_cov154-Amphora_coffeaeformis.AAC.3
MVFATKVSCDPPNSQRAACEFFYPRLVKTAKREKRVRNHEEEKKFNHFLLSRKSYEEPSTNRKTMVQEIFRKHLKSMTFMRKEVLS